MRHFKTAVRLENSVLRPKKKSRWRGKVDSVNRGNAPTRSPMTILATSPGYFSYFAALPLIFFFRTSTYPIFEVNSAAIYIRSIIPCITRRRLEFSPPGISVKKNPEVTSHRFQVITHSASDHFQFVGWHIPTGLLSVQNNETILPHSNCVIKSEILSRLHSLELL